MDNNQAMREFLREKVNIDIVMKYMFIKSMEGRYDDEYLDRMYRIDTTSIRKGYDGLGKEERKKTEENIRKKIAAGEVDLSKEAINWHREGLKRSSIQAVNQKKANKQNREGR